MNGVTIIKEHLYRATEMPEMIAIWIVITLMLVGILSFYRFVYKIADDVKDLKRTTWVCSVILVVMYLICCVRIVSDYNDTHLEYTVEVDDTVGFNDFFDRYEIISVDGDRYRVILKED